MLLEWLETLAKRKASRVGETIIEIIAQKRRRHASRRRNDNALSIDKDAIFKLLSFTKEIYGVNRSFTSKRDSNHIKTVQHINKDSNKITNAIVYDVIYCIVPTNILKPSVSHFLNTLLKQWNKLWVVGISVSRIVTKLNFSNKYKLCS